MIAPPNNCLARGNTIRLLKLKYGRIMVGIKAMMIIIVKDNFDIATEEIFNKVVEVMRNTRTKAPALDAQLNNPELRSVGSSMFTCDGIRRLRRFPVELSYKVGLIIDIF